jgi:hypothetical protein
MLPTDDFLLEVDEELVRIFIAERLGMALQGEAVADRVGDVVRSFCKPRSGEIGKPGHCSG